MILFNNTKKGQGGFTILEVVISIAILSIGILAVAHMETVAVRGNTSAGNLSEGAILVQDVIEGVVAAPYENISDVNGNAIDYNDPDTGANADFTDNTIVNHIVSWNVDENTPETNTKTVQIIVESNAPGGIKTTTFDFIKGCLDPNGVCP